MKDFHIGLVTKDGAQLESFSEDETTMTSSIENDDSLKVENDKTSRFRSIVKKAAFNSPANKWKRTINEVCKA